MILCTGCGTRNHDESRFCEKCGKKLQSDYRPVEQGDDSCGPLTRFQHNGVAPDLKNDLMRMLEAWGYVLLLGGVATGCYFYKTWWPMYPAIALIALVIWLRKI